MDRRVLVKGLFGIAGAGALALVLPPNAEALVNLPPDAPAPGSSVLPNLEELKEGADDGDAPEEGFQLAAHHRRRYRRYYYRRHHDHHRRRGWRWRRYCRRSYWHHHYRRRCYRRRVMFWIGI